MTTEQQVREIVVGLIWASHGKPIEEIDRVAGNAVAALMRLVEPPAKGERLDAAKQQKEEASK